MIKIGNLCNKDNRLTMVVSMLARSTELHWRFSINSKNEQILSIDSKNFSQYHHGMEISEIAAVISRELERRGTNAYRAAVEAGLPQNAIRSVLRGREPGSERLAEICRALELEFYVGPPRGHREETSDSPESSARDPQWVDRLHSGLQELKAQLAASHEEIKALRRQIRP